jgi:hypothetical protein
MVIRYTENMVVRTIPIFRSRRILILVGVTIACAWIALGQEKSAEPEIVIAAKGARPSPPPGAGGIIVLSEGFGSTCKRTSDAKTPQIDSATLTSIAEAMGAPVTRITISSRGRSWKKDGDIRRHILQVLSARTNELAPGIDWDEGVATDLIGTIQFADGKVGSFEESGGHVCFNAHSGAAIFARVQLKASQ